MNICILNSITKLCENKVIVDQPGDFVPYKPGIEVSTRHDGEIGWTLGIDGEWIIPIENRWTPEQKIRNIRNFRLNQSDKYSYPDYPITEEKRSEWLTYRQALRDITSQPGFPSSVTWPTKPE